MMVRQVYKLKYDFKDILFLTILIIEMEDAYLSIIKTRLHCLKQGHMKQQIYYICSQATCENQQLCCYLCQQQMHQSHKMVTIKIFLSKIINISNLSSESLILSASLDKDINQITEFIHQNKHQLTDIDLVMKTFNEYVQNKRNQILSLFNLSQILPKFEPLDQENFQKSFFLFYQAYSHYLEYEQKETNHKDDFFTLILNEISNQIKNTIKTLQTMKKQNKINQYNILSLFPLEFQTSKKFRPYFSESLKAPCMKITNNTAQMSTSGSQRVIALEPSLQLNNKIKKWKIKIVKLASWIGLGACHINKLKQANWNFNYSNTNHGSYFISSNGYSWSSYKPEFNSKFESFSFKTGDVVEIEYNPREKKLKYLKAQTNQQYILEVQTNGDLLHPAVNLTGIGDSVQIVP